MFENSQTADENEEEQILNQIGVDVITHQNWSEVESKNLKEFMEVIGNPFPFMEITAVGCKIVESHQLGDTVRAVEWVRTCGIRGRATHGDYKRVGETMHERHPDIVEIAEQEE